MSKTVNALLNETIRQHYINYLQESQPWGIWSDEENIANGMEPMTIDELIEVINELED